MEVDSHTLRRNPSITRQALAWNHRAAGREADENHLEKNHRTGDEERWAVVATSGGPKTGMEEQC